jgi:hypothetical protein
MTYGELIILAKKLLSNDPSLTIEQLSNLLPPRSEFDRNNIRLEAIEIAIWEYNKISEPLPNDYEDYLDAQDN